MKKGARFFMKNCPICGNSPKSPWFLRVKGEYINHCADSCHTPFIAEEAKEFVKFKRAEIESYKKNFKGGR